MGSMYPVLKNPNDFPRWATDSGRVLEPSSGVKDVGWQIDDVPPARWMNWIQNTQYEWTKNVVALQVSNWTPNENLSYVNPLLAVIYHPDVGEWLSVEAVTNAVYNSFDGSYWILDSASIGAGTNIVRSIAIDSQYTIFGRDAGLVYRNFSGTYNTITNATIGCSTQKCGVITGYPDYDDIILCAPAGGGDIWIASSVTGTWSAATTQPPSFPGSTTTGHLARLDTNTYYLCAATTSGTAKAYRSTDKGDNWTAVTTDPFSTGIPVHAAYNPNDGVLIEVGSEVTTLACKIEYSLDSGDSWTAATIDLDGLDEDNHELETVYYCGGEIWVAAGQSASGKERGFILVSKDNGLNWYRGVVQSTSSTSITSITHISGSNTLLVGAASDELINCLSLGV